MHSEHTSLHMWMMTQLPLSNLSLLLHVICGLLNGQNSGDQSCFIRLGSPEPGARMKRLDIYSSAAVVLPVCSETLSLPPLQRAGWAWCRHPHKRQTDTFSFIVAVLGCHCAWFGDCEGLGINCSGCNRHSD